MTECTQESLAFADHFSRRVVANFDGARMTSDGGGLLLRRTERKIRLLQRAAACFRDGRDPARVEHTVGEMLAQRIYGLALGYEDLNDHGCPCHHSLLALLAGKPEVEEALAGKSTLNRMELTPAGAPAAAADRYHKISYSAEPLDALLVDIFLEAHATAPAEMVLDLDVTDTPLVWPSRKRASSTATTASTVICRCTNSAGEHLLCARQRASNQDASAGALAEVGAGASCARFASAGPK